MRALITLLWCLLPGIAFAAPESVFVYGEHGMKSCGAFVAAAEASPLGQALQGTEDGIQMYSEKYVMLEFVRGYLTAKNIGASSSHQTQADGAALELWLRNYCNAHPTEMLVTAADRFYKEQAKKWSTAPAP